MEKMCIKFLALWTVIKECYFSLFPFFSGLGSMRQLCSRNQVIEISVPASSLNGRMTLERSFNLSIF